MGGNERPDEFYARAADSGGVVYGLHAALIISVGLAVVVAALTFGLREGGRMSSARSAGASAPASLDSPP